MGKKRGHGEGTVFYREDRKCFVAVMSYTDPLTGKFKRRKFHGETEKQARDRMKKAQREIDAGFFPEKEKLTVGKWLDRWFADYACPNLEIKTQEKYSSQIQHYIKPYIGELLLSKLRATNVQRLYKHLLQAGSVKSGKGLSPQTVKHVHNVLRGAIKKAKKLGLVRQNVVDDAEPPKQKRPAIMPMNLDQARALLAAAKNHRLYALIMLALATGLRRGELFGLKWADVDLDAGVITVRRQLTTTAHGLIFSEPKSAMSRRRVCLSADVVRELRRHHSTQAQEKLRNRPVYEDTDLVFSTEYGQPTDPNNFDKVYKRFLRSAGLPSFRFHDMRHFHASLLLKQGEHPKVISERLGHASIALTIDVYSHLFPDMQESAARKLDGVLSDPEGKPGKSLTTA